MTLCLAERCWAAIASRVRKRTMRQLRGVALSAITAAALRPRQEQNASSSAARRGAHPSPTIYFMTIIYVPGVAKLFRLPLSFIDSAKVMSCRLDILYLIRLRLFVKCTSCLC